MVMKPDIVLHNITRLIERREAIEMSSKHPVERLVSTWEMPIREAMKRFYVGNTFSQLGIVKAQGNRSSLLESLDYEFTEGSVHNSWRSVDASRRTAACLFEQHRARIWALGPLFSKLASNAHDMHFVTFAKPSHQKRASKLSRFNATNYRRTIEGALRDLGQDFPRLIAAGVIEISARPEPDGSRFEPHCHLLIYGAPEQQIRAQLAQLAKGAPRAIMILPVRNIQQLGERLSYMFKFVPESRVLFERADGRTGHGHNLMTGDALAEWLSWLSRYRVDELLITHGFPGDFRREMRELEMKVLVPALLKSARKMPSRG